MEYREVFENIMKPLREVGYPELRQVWAAQKITDAIWEILFLLPESQGNNIPDGVVTSISDAIKSSNKPRLSQYLNSNWFSE